MTRRALFALVAGIVSGKAASTDKIVSDLTFLMSDILPFWEYRIKSARTLSELKRMNGRESAPFELPIVPGSFQPIAEWQRGLLYSKLKKVKL